jgi:hypothetical protein
MKDTIPLPKSLETLCAAGMLICIAEKLNLGIHISFSMGLKGFS